MRYPFQGWELPELQKDAESGQYVGGNEFFAIVSTLLDLRDLQYQQLQTLQQINAKLDAVIAAPAAPKKGLLARLFS